MYLLFLSLTLTMFLFYSNVHNKGSSSLDVWFIFIDKSESSHFFVCLTSGTVIVHGF